MGAEVTSLREERFMLLGLGRCFQVCFGAGFRVKLSSSSCCVASTVLELTAKVAIITGCYRDRNCTNKLKRTEATSNTVTIAEAQVTTIASVRK